MSDAVTEAKRAMANWSGNQSKAVVELREAVANLLAHVERPVDAEVERVADRVERVDTDTQADREAVNEAASLLRSLAAENARRLDVIQQRNTYIFDLEDEHEAELTRLAAERTNQDIMIRALTDERDSAQAELTRLIAPVTDEKRAELLRKLRQEYITDAWRRSEDFGLWKEDLCLEAADMLEADARKWAQVRREEDNEP